METCKMFHYQDIRPQQLFSINTDYTSCNKPVILHHLMTDHNVSASGQHSGGYQEISTQPLPTLEPEVATECGHSKSIATMRLKRVKKKKKTNVDTSRFTIEERLISAAWVHERTRLRLSLGQIKRDFLQRFQKDPPAKNTLLIWEKKLFTTGSVHDAKRSGRPCQRREHIEAVKNSISTSPSLSLRARAASLSLPRTTLRKILSEDLRGVEKHKKKSRNEGNAVIKIKSTRNAAKLDRPVNRTIKTKSKPALPPPSNQYQIPPEPLLQQQQNLNHANYRSCSDVMVPIHQFPYYQNTAEIKMHHQNAPPMQQHYVLGQMQTHHI